jgi:cysteinyl-tRNA synthetase
VTEFIPEIVDCITHIIGNGFAYESNGSVYFDSAAMLERSSHARLMPSRLTNNDQNNDNADDDNNNDGDSGEKRHRHDFALWKRTDDNDMNSWGNR